MKYKLSNRAINAPIFLGQICPWLWTVIKKIINSFPLLLLRLARTQCGESNFKKKEINSTSSKEES